MLIAIIIILALFFILALNSSINPEKKKNVLTREEITINLKEYPYEYVFSVAGVHLSHYSYAVFNICKVHDLVTLIPESNNRYDSNAIIVQVSGSEIGYVPTDETFEVHKILSKEHICFVESKSIYDYINVTIKIRYKN